MKKILILIVLLTLTSCAKVEFDGFDPPTGFVRWIINENKKNR